MSAPLIQFFHDEKGLRRRVFHDPLNKNQTFEHVSVQSLKKSQKLLW